MNQGFDTVSSDGLDISSNVRSADQMGRAFEKANPAPKDAPEAPEPAKVEAEAPDEPEAAPEATTEPKPDEKPGHKASKNPRVRIEEATREAAQAKRERDEIQRRAEAAEAELKRYREQAPRAPEPEPAKKDAPKADGRPKLEDFENLEDFTDAVTEWKLETRDKQAKERENETLREKARDSRLTAFRDRIQTHLKANPNFFDNVDPNLIALRPLSELGPTEPRTQMNLAADYILDSEEPAKLFEYFTANPEEVRRFLTLHPMQIGKEIGKIEGKLGAAITAPVPEPEVSKASPPARPVAGGPPTVGEPGPNASFDEWAKYQIAKAERDRRAKRR